MIKIPFIKLARVGFIAAFVLPMSAWAQTVVSELVVMVVTQKSDGQESFAAVSAVKPGDLLQYTAVYRNTGKLPAKQMLATLPIPAQTEYVASSTAPATALASLDGKLYEPMPLKRKVKQADGKLVDVAVPLVQYRFLRWPEHELAAGGSYTTSARVRVISSAAAVLPASAVSGAK